MVKSRCDQDPGVHFRPMRALTLAMVLCLSLASGAARAVDDITVDAIRREGALEVVCRATLGAPLALIWQTLTDYGRLAEFIPGMRSSRVLSQDGAVSVVEQIGEARFLFIAYPIEVTLASTERPPYSIEARMLKGNMKRLEGVYRIEPQAGGRYAVSWTGVVEAESMPPLFGEMLMRSSIEDQFRGMVVEIERRDAARRERENRK